MDKLNLRRYKLIIIAFSVFFILEIAKSIYSDYSESVRIKHYEQEKEDNEQKEEDESEQDSGFIQRQKGNIKKQSDNKPIKTANNLNICSEIVDAYAEDQKNKNVVFSPTSFNHALGMVQSGASPELKKVVDDILNNENYNNVAKKYIKSLNNMDFDDNNTINIANSLWYADDIEIKREYKNKLKSYYKAEVDSFSNNKPVASAAKINSWIDKNTSGLIKEVLNEDIFKPDLKTILVNTVYFNSEWENKWIVQLDNNDEEIKKPFYNNNNEMVCYMENNGECYYENEYAQAFSCDYKLPGLTFIGILPKKTGPFTLKELNIDGLLLSGQSYEGDLVIIMPKLNYSSNIPLKGILKDLGHEELFNFKMDILKNNGLSDKFLVVDNIFQKAKIELNEEYTRAAATTVVTDIMTVSLIDKKKEINLNRPFAFLIYDKKNDEILFMGKVVTSIMEE